MKHRENKIVWKNNEFFKNVEEVLLQGKLVKMRVRGKSMNPVLQENDVVILGRTERPIDQKKGNIVLAKYEGNYILHRIVWVTKLHFYLAGDGNRVQVEKVKKEDVFAMVKEAARGKEKLPLEYSTTSIQMMLRPLWYIINNVKKKLL